MEPRSAGLARGSLLLSGLCSQGTWEPLQWKNLRREVSPVQVDAHQALGSTHSSCICIYLHAGFRGIGYRPQNRLISATNQWARSCRILLTKVKGATNLKMIHFITSWVSRANPELAQPPTISPFRSEARPSTGRASPAPFTGRTDEAWMMQIQTQIYVCLI